VIAWDAPGAGQSVDPSETFGIGDWADEFTVGSRPRDRLVLNRRHLVALGHAD
jgi:hypothetical protein